MSFSGIEIGIEIEIDFFILYFFDFDGSNSDFWLLRSRLESLGRLTKKYKRRKTLI